MIPQEFIDALALAAGREEDEFEADGLPATFLAAGWGRSLDRLEHIDALLRAGIDKLAAE